MTNSHFFQGGQEGYISSDAKAPAGAGASKSDRQGRMATKDRGTRPGKKIPLTELAMILVFADLNTDRKASAEFGIAARTIQRHRKAMLSGRMPSLSQLVAKLKSETLEHQRDVLVLAFEESLNRVRELLPGATLAEARGAMRDIGELMLQRDVLRDDESSSADTEGREAEETEGGAAGSFPAPPVQHPAIN